MFAAVVARLTLRITDGNELLGAPVSDTGQKDQCFIKLFLSFPSLWGFGDFFLVLFFVLFCFRVYFA